MGNSNCIFKDDTDSVSDEEEKKTIEIQESRRKYIKDFEYHVHKMISKLHKKIKTTKFEKLGIDEISFSFRYAEPWFSLLPELKIIASILENAKYDPMNPLVNAVQEEIFRQQYTTGYLKVNEYVRYKFNKRFRHKMIMRRAVLVYSFNTNDWELIINIKILHNGEFDF